MREDWKQKGCKNKNSPKGKLKSFFLFVHVGRGVFTVESITRGAFLNLKCLIWSFEGIATQEKSRNSLEVRSWVGASLASIGNFWQGGIRVPCVEFKTRN